MIDMVNVIDPLRGSIYPSKLAHDEQGYYLEPSTEDLQSNLFLSPGWIDLHVHVYDGVTPIGIPADSIGLKTGVHLLADAGSAGESTLNGIVDVLRGVTQAPAEVLKLNNWCSLTGILKHATLFRISNQPATDRPYIDTMGQEILPKETITPIAVIQNGAMEWI